MFIIQVSLSSFFFYLYFHFHDFSLLRTCTEEEAKQAYEAYSKILSPLVDSCGKEVLCQGVLQKVLDFLREHLSWHVGHITSHFGFLEALKNEEVQRYG